MSGKTRAFAFTVGTAALVALSAPVAHAATLGGPNTSGFNNDSIVNTSGNQLPIQVCNNDVPINGGFLVGQVPLSDISALLGLVNAGSNTEVDGRTCAQAPSQTITSTTNSASTSSDPASTRQAGPNHAWPNQANHANTDSASYGSSDYAKNTSGFNNDSIINTSNNQLPIQVCNNDVPINGGVGAVQVPAEDIAGVLGLFNYGSSSAIDARNCTNLPTQDNSSTTNSASSNG